MIQKEMEAHPVPQNVTAFEFHLVGDMTVKQFIYLASGLAIAYLTFVTLATLLPLIAWPMIVFFALTGVAFAFIPIQERPLDHWVGAFFRAIFKPTQRIWSKKEVKDPRAILPFRLNLYLNGMSNRAEQGVASAQPNLSVISQMAPSSQTMIRNQAPVAPSTLVPTNVAPAPAPTQPPTPQTQPAKEVEKVEESLPTPQELSQTVTLASKAQVIQAKIVEAEHELDQIKARAAAPGVDPKEFTEEFQKVLSQLQILTNQASEISKELAVLSEPAKVAQAPAPKVVVRAEKRVAPPNIVLTQSPNIINGIVTDSLGNYLEGVIVVTHNKEGLPVRALKTNKLGQFVAATPLPSGSYTITLEKENLSFDTIAVELIGQVLKPILVSANKVGG